MCFIQESEIWNENVEKPQGNSCKATRVRQHDVMKADLSDGGGVVAAAHQQESADRRDARNSVRNTHQRRVQRGRHSPDRVIADDACTHVVVFD